MGLAPVISNAGIAQKTTSRPNIVFILADDMGWNDLGCYGNKYIETPCIDSLSKKGVRFTQAYSCSPVSSPSRAGILTGKNPALLQLTNYIGGNNVDKNSAVLPAKWKPYLVSSETTIAEVLHTKSYKSAMIGKWHLGNDKGMNPWEQGFDFTRMIGKNGLDYYNYTILTDSFKVDYEDNGTNYLTDKLTDYGLEFIEKNKTNPFFLYMAYSAPHVFLVPKAGSERKYLMKYSENSSEYQNPYYAAMVNTLDEGVGKIVQKLRETGQLENTIIVFTSDNGGVSVEELGPQPTSVLPLRACKGSVYEGGILIPAIVSYPGVVAENLTCDVPFSNTAYFPTFLELLSIENPTKNLDTQSIIPLLILKENSPYVQDTLFWHYPHFSNQGGRPASAVRCGDYKLIQKYETNSVELYNIKNDIGESHDLSRKLKAKTASLLKMLENWKRNNQLELPIQNPNYTKNKQSTQTKSKITKHEQD